MTRKEYLKIFLLALIIILIYLNSIDGAFQFDDFYFIVLPPAVKKCTTLIDLGKQIIQYLPHSYRPLRTLSFMIDYYLFRLNPPPYHIENILFYILLCTMVYLVARELLQDSRLSFLLAILFSTHPIHTENVSYISGRRELLSANFTFLGFLLFLKYRKNRSNQYLAWILTCFVLGILSKEDAIVLPILCFVYDILFKENLTKGVKSFYLITLLLAFLFVGYTIFIKQPSQQHQWYGGNLIFNILTVARVFIYYIRLLLFPYPQCADYSFYGFPVTTDWGDWRGWISIASLLIIIAVLFLIYKKNVLVSLSGLWFFISLIPVAQIIPHHELMGERFLLIPSFGFLLLLIILLDKLMHPRSLLFFIIIISIIFSILTINRNFVWRNEFTLWQNTCKVSPNCARAHMNLGKIYAKMGNLKEAEKEFKLGCALYPKPNYYYTLINLLLSEKKLEEAYKFLQEIYPKALDNAELNLAMANYYYQKGNYPESLNYLKKALELEPTSPIINYNIGNIYRKLKENELARKFFQRTLQLDPNFLKNKEILEFLAK